ncbi:MAG: GreA/GreB family elongation factor, partial [bacterium]
IKEIDNILKHAEIIKDTNSKFVTIGKTVTIKFVGSNMTREFTIVGHLEANPLQGKISNESPIGKAIINMKKGAKITYKAETGAEMKIEILDIK